MTNITNYLRLLLNAGILWAANQLNLPLDGLSETAAELTNWGVDAVILTLSWVVVRYVVPRLPADLAEKLAKLSCIALVAGMTCLALPSCADYEGVTGSIYYRDPSTGAKGGLVFSEGESPQAYAKIPVYDEETGEVIGMVDVSAPIAIPVDSESSK